MDTDTESFIRWAFDDARTLEERSTTELLVERAEITYHSLHQTGKYRSIEQTLARQRERLLNPAYQPSFSEASVWRAGEVLPLMKVFELTNSPYSDRTIRDIAVLRFLPALEKLTLNCDIADLSLLTELAHLRELHLLQRGAADEEIVEEPPATL